MNTNKNKETIKELSISELRPFKEHPYRVVDDGEMERLVESIEEHGVMTPINVRPIECGYEGIFGHRRIHAAKRAGLNTIPAIEMDMTRDIKDFCALCLSDRTKNRVFSTRVFLCLKCLKSNDYKGFLKLRISTWISLESLKTGCVAHRLHTLLDSVFSAV